VKGNTYYADKYKAMYMAMAEVCSLESKAIRRKVGCVILLENMTVLHGFNGTPSGSPSEVCEGADGLTLPNVLHAEVNALREATECSVDTSGGVCFVTTSPCEGCSGELYVAGISKVYYKDRQSNLEHLPHYEKLGMEFIQL
jgi:dCMP deaminase